jgi:hypothetical protein
MAFEMVIFVWPSDSVVSKVRSTHQSSTHSAPWMRSTEQNQPSQEDTTSGLDDGRPDDL